MSDPVGSIDTSARSIGWIEPGAITDAEWEKISAFFDPRADLKQDDVFPFRFNAASNGVDAYYTRQDLETSLNPMAQDLQRGQAYMGNHDITSFAYGTSFDGRVVDADALSRAYEPTFYRHYDRPEYRATKWLVGDYYVLRGATYNGQSTDDLIRGMLAGIHRKASITFTIGEYVCDLDGREMLPTFFGPMGDDECEHFPGVVYDDRLSTATMKHNSLLETSNVYKNASPGALYVARAMSLAEHGVLPQRDVARIEERIGQRLPGTLQRVFPAAVRKEDPSEMTKRSTETPEAELENAPETPAPEEKPLEKPAAEPEGTDESGEQPETPETPQEAPSGEDTVAEFVTSTGRMINVIAADPDADTLDKVAEASRQLDIALSEAGREDTASGGAARQYEMREHAIEEALGEKLTVEAIRSLKTLADMGQTLFAKRVDEAKKERVRALGDHANAETYAKTLLTMRDVEYVESEIVAYQALKREALAPRRQTTAPEPTETKATRRVPAEPEATGREQSNLMNRRHPNEES